jgi:hypothetical protein
VDGVGGLGDSGVEQVEGCPRRRNRGWSGRAVEADDGVEVDDAASLVLSNFGVGDPELGGELLAGQPSAASNRPAEGDGEPPPQFGSAGVEQDRATVLTSSEPWLPTGA